ncbi:MAG: MurR/RpiR family transcriptional regulator, partial [Oscillospiraceae bacterium]|nr:MurR/RpiR family transcriptional regulator [Oscillospiraceae bacterium]
MVSAVIAKIISMQSSLTVSENEIAQYVINHPDQVVVSTITAAAQSTHTSEASINRFCKKIGFKGFNSFKVALAQDSFYNSMREAEPVSQDSFIAAISQDYRHMLINTTAMLDENQVFRAAAEMYKASHIYIFSMSNTRFVAQQLEFRLGMAGLYSKAVTDLNDARILASGIGRDDVVLVIAPTLLVKELYQAISICHGNGAVVISITSYDSPKLGDLIDHKFIISDKITTQNSVSISNNLMFLYVTDVLYCALLDKDKNLRQRRLNSDSILDS